MWGDYSLNPCKPNQLGKVRRLWVVHLSQNLLRSRSYPLMRFKSELSNVCVSNVETSGVGNLSVKLANLLFCWKMKLKRKRLRNPLNSQIMILWKRSPNLTILKGRLNCPLTH